MLTVTGLWFDHERTPVGLDHTPVFGWQLEGNCRNIRQTQYRLQVALTPDFAALLYDETCETGNSTAVHAAGLTLQSLQKYYARVQVWADTAAGPQQTLWSEPAVFITALLDPAAEWKAEFVSAESPETCRESSAGTMVRAAFTVKPGLRAAYACTTALGLYCAGHELCLWRILPRTGGSAVRHGHPVQPHGGKHRKFCPAAGAAALETHLPPQ